jgi:hypothetical protein
MSISFLASQKRKSRENINILGKSINKHDSNFYTNLTEFFILGKLSLFELNEKITNSAEEDIVVFTKTLDIMQKEKQRTKTTRKNEYSYK